MPETYTNPSGDRRSLTHTGLEVEPENVTLNQNATGREDLIISWECPRKFSSITFSAGDHITKFEPRTKEVASGDGTTTTFTLTSNIDAPNGETTLVEMEYQPVVAYDTASGTELEVTSYDFDQNTVTFASAPSTGTDNILMWPILTEGTVKFIGFDQFDNQIAALDSWGIPIHVFNDFNQHKNLTQIHLTGAATWEESERLALFLESDHQLVWEDADYPRGQYASQIEQRVDVDV